MIGVAYRLIAGPRAKKVWLEIRTVAGPFSAVQ
jgi:hypothetical protein